MKKDVKNDLTNSYLNLCQIWAFFAPGMWRLWNSLILDATKADTSGSRRSAAERVLKKEDKKKKQTRYTQPLY